MGVNNTKKSFIKLPPGLPFCTGPGISCVSQTMGNIGEEGENYVIDKFR
jgi:hypothetical protein